MISETDIAYIAGLFDGEGNINIAKRREKETRNDVKRKREMARFMKQTAGVYLWRLP